MNSARRILHSRLKTIDFCTRQIDIQTSQPLHNIAERRCLLNALQKFGEVATFISGRDDDKSKLTAIYETPEAASKAVDASPLTVILSPPPAARADTLIHGHEPVVDANITCAISAATNSSNADEQNEARIRSNPWNNFHTGYTWDKTDPAIRNDTRIADIIAAGAPRGVFADGVIEASYLRSGQGEIFQNNKLKERMKKVELQGSLLALLEE